ncbi:LysR family transcriptional regulator [Novisyntrophococcus fermenticellae]|uniref:LysR family transcriptional regulator n=1 Tax=Novisyntrophococcus fermenticellae TaxID=2068655 RepID=UPI001E4F3600|nr:LysR family transcriptional regulator [Novisyntrophococcus fermenticellae]
MDQGLSQYYVFYITALCGNISKAAEKLYISQPAISKSIQKLEKTLKTSLFKRTSRGVTLTEDGELLFQHVREAFSQLETAEQILERKHTLGISHLRIGASATLCKYVLLPYLQDFVVTNPHVKITISCQSSYKTIELLQDEKIDVGLIGTPSTSKSFEYFPILSIQDTFVATDAYLSNLSLREETSNLNHTATFMMLDDENITRQYINDCLKEQSIQLENILEVSTMDLLIEYAKIGLGIGCVIKEFVQDELSNHALTEVPLKIQIPKRGIGFAFLKESMSIMPVNTFLQQVTKMQC